MSTPDNPADTLLYVIGPVPGPAVLALRALGYRAIDSSLLPDAAVPVIIANADGIASADEFTETEQDMAALRLGQALGKPALPLTVWAQASAPGAEAWFAELFEGAL